MYSVGGCLSGPVHSDLGIYCLNNLGEEIKNHESLHRIPVLLLKLKIYKERTSEERVVIGLFNPIWGISSGYKATLRGFAVLSVTVS